MSYIPRERIESDHEIILPYFYQDQVKTLLTDLSISLSQIIGNTKTVKTQEKSSFNNPLIFSWFPSFNNYSYDNSSHFHTHHHIPHHAKNWKSSYPHGTKQQENLLLFAVGACALGILGTTCYYLGKSITAVNDLSEEILNVEKLNEFITKTEEQTHKLNAQGYLVKKTDVLNIQLYKLKEIAGAKGIFSKLQTDASRDLKLRVGLIAGAIIIMVGAIIASKAVLIVGATVLTFAAFLILLKLGIGSDKNRIFQESEKIQTSIKTIINALNSLPQEKANIPTYFYKINVEIVQENLKASAPPADEEYYSSLENTTPFEVRSNYNDQYSQYVEKQYAAMRQNNYTPVFPPVYQYGYYPNYQAQNQQNGYN
jgi:hypothetical protein